VPNWSEPFFNTKVRVTSEFSWIEKKLMSMSIGLDLLLPQTQRGNNYNSHNNHSSNSNSSNLLCHNLTKKRRSNHGLRSSSISKSLSNKHQAKMFQKEGGVNQFAHNEKLIKTNNITAYIKTNKEKWDSCLIKTGPNSYVGPAFCLKCFVIIV